MKALVLLLLLFNVAFFTWVHLVGNGAPPAAQPEPGAVRRLELVSERGAPARLRCLSVGPYGEQAAAERAMVLARSSQRDARVRRAEAEGSASYRVVVTTATLQLATSIATRLKAAGVGDLEIVPPQAGGTEAVVALGVYGDRQRAQRRVAELQRYSITPVLLEVPRNSSNWWLDVAERAPNPAFDAAWVLKLVAAPAGSAVVNCPAGGGSSPPAPATPASSPTGARPA